MTERIELRLHRHAKKDRYTIGRLYLNGEYYCDTLEDKDRGLDQKLPLSENVKRKVYGETAIPAGTYRITTTIWSKYKRRVVKICDVPAFTDILIHNGATEKDTLGCVIVGKNKVKGRVSDGKQYMDALAKLVYEAEKRGAICTIEIG